MNKKHIALSLINIMALTAGLCYGYDDKYNHKTLSLNATVKSNTDDFIKRHLIFKDGRKQVFFLGKNVEEVIQDGANIEDSQALCRASNHFHNPLNSIPWSDAFLKDEPWVVKTYCSSGLNEGGRYAVKHSAVIWATGYTGPSSLPGASKVTTSNERDWDIARDSFLRALTANSQAERNAAYADTFLTLGFVLHMLQDMAVPAHVRSDFQSHWKIQWDNSSWIDIPFVGNEYEAFVKMNDALIATRPPVFPTPAVRPLTGYWDTNRYTAGCGDLNGRMSGTNLGLAEYANANFVSMNTMFTENAALCGKQYGFPHPRLDETVNGGQFELEYFQAKDGLTDRVKVIKIWDDDRAPGENPTRAIASVRYLAQYLTPPEGGFLVFDRYRRDFFFNPNDDVVFRDTADRLLPRAVGYSAALLDYFFRGRFEAPSTSTPFVETVAADTIRLHIRNGSGEAMSGGTLELYQDGGDENVPGAVNPLQRLASAALATLSDGAVYSGNEFNNVRVTVPNGLSLDNVILTLVFRGRLGDEEGAVVARRFKAAAYVPQVTFPVAWMPVPTPPVPDPVPSHRSHQPSFYYGSDPPADHEIYSVPSWMVSVASLPPASYPASLQTGAIINNCNTCHYMGWRYPTYGSYLVSPMTNLELCGNCHGRRASANPVPSKAPPRILVSPEAADPGWKAPGVSSFNPKSGDTVRGLVQFLPALFDFAMLGSGETQGPFQYRVEVRSMDGQTLVTCFPGRSGGAFTWRKATGFVFLRDWTDWGGLHQEKLLWDSTGVPNDRYRFLFFPMRDPWLYPGPQIGSPAELVLTVQN